MRRRRRPQPVCAAQGCGRSIEGWKRLCDGCWKRLPFHRRKAIAEAGQARAPHIVAELAKEAVIWLAEHSPAAEAARRTGEAPGG